MDSFAIAYLSDYTSTASTDHGRSARLWGEIAMGLTSSAIGRLVFSSSSDTPQFIYAFVVRVVSFIPCMVCLITMRQQQQQNRRNENENDKCNQSVDATKTNQGKEEAERPKGQRLNGTVANHTPIEDEVIVHPPLHQNGHSAGSSTKTATFPFTTISSNEKIKDAVPRYVAPSSIRYNTVFFFVLVFLNGIGEFLLNPKKLYLALSKDLLLCSHSKTPLS